VALTGVLSANLGAASPDPYLISSSGNSFRQTAGLTVRSAAINPAKKTLVLITSGQSLLANVVPSAAVPTNSSVIDQMNIHDGALYSISDQLLGASSFLTNLGNASTRIADKLVPTFDRVIIVAISIGSTSAADWSRTGIYGTRGPVTLRRLAARGITASTPGVTFACIFAIGNTDFGNGTSGATFSAGVTDFMSAMLAEGFSGRFFIPTESASGQTSNAIRTAQAALWNGSTVFSGGDFDSATIATYDGTHPSDAGAATMATIAYNAIAASGSPY
jgi:hypothetical protein